MQPLSGIKAKSPNILQGIVVVLYIHRKSTTGGSAKKKVPHGFVGEGY